MNPGRVKERRGKVKENMQTRMNNKVWSKVGNAKQVDREKRRQNEERRGAEDKIKGY